MTRGRGQNITKDYIQNLKKNIPLKTVGQKCCNLWGTSSCGDDKMLLNSWAPGVSWATMMGWGGGGGHFFYIVIEREKILKIVQSSFGQKSCKLCRPSSGSIDSGLFTS